MKPHDMQPHASPGGKVVDGDGKTVVSGSGDVTVTVTGSY